MRKFILFLLPTLMLSACSFTNTESNPPVTNTYTLSSNELLVIESGYEALPTVLLNDKKYEGSVTWTVLDTSVAAIVNNQIYGLKEGTTKLQTTVDSTDLSCDIEVIGLAKAAFIVWGSKKKDEDDNTVYYFLGAQYYSDEIVGTEIYNHCTYGWEFSFTPATNMFVIDVSWQFDRSDGVSCKTRGLIGFTWGDYRNAIFRASYTVGSKSMGVQFVNSCITFVESGQNIGIEDTYTYYKLWNDWDEQGLDIDSLDLSILWHSVKAGNNFVRDFLQEDDQIYKLGLKLF